MRRDTLLSKGLPLEVFELKGRTHEYYGPDGTLVNQQAWAFLEPHVLSADPVFAKYDLLR